MQLLGHGHHWLLAVSTPMNSCSSLVARWTGSWHHKFAQLPRNGMRSRLAALAGTDSALVRESVEFQLQWHCCTHVPRGTLSADGAECKNWQVGTESILKWNGFPTAMPCTKNVGACNNFSIIQGCLSMSQMRKLLDLSPVQATWHEFRPWPQRLAWPKVKVEWYALFWFQQVYW